MKISIVTLFPEMFAGVFEHGMMRKATEIGAASFELVNLRQFGEGPRLTVDDMPYGGGDGMILMAEPLAKAIESAKSASSNSAITILMTPRGETYLQSRAKKLALAGQDLILVCGRYEGVDERITSLIDLELSIGNYVLTGGEIPAMIVADSVVRLLPDVLGGETSAEIESFDDDKTLEWPHYTRPAEWRGQKVPEVLLSGHHAEIEKWRQAQSTEITRKRQSAEN